MAGILLVLLLALLPVAAAAQSTTPADCGTPAVLADGWEVEWSLGLGQGGQRLFIVPAFDLVLLVHAGLYQSLIKGAVPLMVLNRYLLAAVKEP